MSEENKPARLWQELLGKKKPVNSLRLSIYEAKNRLLKMLPRQFLEGERDCSLSSDELAVILEKLKTESSGDRKVKNSAGLYTNLCRFLHRGLSRGKRDLGWQVALPSVPQVIPRERARITPQKFAALPAIDHIEKLFLSSLIDNSLLSPKEELGRLLLSALLYGGLVKNVWLDPWVAGLVKGEVKTDVRLMWIDMQRVWQYAHQEGEVKQESRKRAKEIPIIMTRRWVADPLTKALIAIWLQKGVAYPANLPNAIDLVWLFLRKLGIQSTAMPPKRSFLEMVETRLSLRVSPFLASYASGWIASVSVPAETWARLCSGKAVRKERSGDQDGGAESSLVAASKWRTITDPAPFDVQEKLLKKMRKIFSRKDGRKKSIYQMRNEMESFVILHGPELCSCLELMIDWLMTTYLAASSRYSPSTPERYSSVCDVLLHAFEEDDLRQMDAAEFIECYDRACEMVKSEAESGRARQIIGMFHSFLVWKHNAPAISQGFFRRRSGPPETTVDANLVSQIDFDRVKLALGFDKKDRSGTATAVLAVAILGFRCGLRRNEVRYLRVLDIEDGHRPELILRPTKFRRLKSSQSARRIPLHVLVPQDELDLLLSWRDDRLAKSREALLFSSPSDSLVPIPEVILFNPIREALALVTGDNTLRYHHLRHSFASWLLLRLTGRAAGMRTAAPFLDHPEFDDARISGLRESLLANCPLGRKGAFAVSALCGHADLTTTFTSYFHLCDWMLAHELTSPPALPLIPVGAAQTLMGLAEPSVYRAMIKSGNSDVRGWGRWPDFISKKKEILLGSYHDPMMKTAQEPHIVPIEINDPLGPPDWVTAERALLMFQRKHKRPDVIARELKVGKETVDHWIHRAKYIADKGIDAWGRYFKHRDLGTTGFWKKKPRWKDNPKRKMPRRKTIWMSVRKSVAKQIFPIPPKGGERRLVEKMLDRFETLDPQSQERILDQVDLFIEKYNMLTGIIRFGEEKRAACYVSALKQLGISTKQIRLVDCFDNRGTEPDRRGKWEKVLGLSDPVWEGPGWKRGRNGGEGTIGIRVMTVTGNRASYGFRYALYMLAIVYWQ